MIDNEERTFSPEEISILKKSYKIDSPCVSCRLNDLSKSCSDCQEEKDFFAIYEDVIKYELEVPDATLHKCRINLNNAVKTIKEYKQLKDSLPDELKIISFDDEIKQLQEELSTIS